MVLKDERRYIKGPLPLDESWWTAVLKDVEERYSGDETSISSQGKPPEDQQARAEDGINWCRVKDLFEQDQVIQLEVTGYNRGGLLVQGEKVFGFVPISHIHGVHTRQSRKKCEAWLSSYVGRHLRLKVIEYDPAQERIVFSERAARAKPGSRIKLLNSLEVGDCLTGRVSTITKFGVFVDLGGVEGLIHISELSWGRVTHPKEVVALGEEVEVCVLQLDKERQRIALSLKRLRPNPWETIHTRYQTGQVTSARITDIVSYGAFARLEDGLDGLIHVSELRSSGIGTSPADLFDEGQEVQVRILHIDPQRHRLGLSLYERNEDVS